MSDDEDHPQLTDTQKLTNLAEDAGLEGIVQIKDVVNRLMTSHMTVEVLLKYKDEETFKNDLLKTGPGAPGLSLGVAKSLWEALEYPARC